GHGIVTEGLAERSEPLDELEHLVVVPEPIRERAAPLDYGCHADPVVELFEQTLRFVEPRAGLREVSNQAGGARATQKRIRAILSSASGQGDARYGPRVPVARPDTQESPDATE